MPVRGSVNEFEALLAKVMLSEAAPLTWGVNVTVKGTLWPAARFKGSGSPLSVNSKLCRLAELTVTLVPVALRVAVKLALLPTTTLPKFKVAGLTPNCPRAVPEPATAIARGELDAFETTEMFPLALPADTGAKAALNVKLCPGARVSGRPSPLTLNPEPLTLT